MDLDLTPQDIDCILSAYPFNKEAHTSFSLETLKTTVDKVLEALDQGHIRIAEKQGDNWIVHSWIKQAILLAFALYPTQAQDTSGTSWDKIPLKYGPHRPLPSSPTGRIVPGAVIRYGAFLGPQTVIMPSFINIGAYIGRNTLVDTWATVGSCAQIGENVHISGGAGIGGVLEPLQAQPTIIENNCFIGARSEVVEGVIVEEGSVIGMGVFLGASTKIYHRQKRTISYGRIPAGSVVVPGSLPSKSGDAQLYCAVIVKEVDAKTRSKTSINELLRTEEVD